MPASAPSAATPHHAGPGRELTREEGEREEEEEGRGGTGAGPGAALGLGSETRARCESPRRLSATRVPGAALGHRALPQPSPPSPPPLIHVLLEPLPPGRPPACGSELVPPPGGTPGGLLRAPA